MTLRAVAFNQSTTTPVVPAPGGSANTLYLSSSLSKLRADPTPASRFPLGLGHNVQEPSLWFANGLLNLLYTANGVWYTSMSQTNDPRQNFSCVGSISGSTLTITAMNWGLVRVGHALRDMNSINNVVPRSTTITAQLTGATGGIGTYSLSFGSGTAATVQAQTLVGSWWAQPVSVIGNTGQSGYSGGAFHGSLYQEGTTLYYTFIDGSNNVRLATAPASTPTVWTTQGAALLNSFGSGMGCPCIAKQGNTYYLFIENAQSYTNPGEGAVTCYRICLASCSTVSGTYSLIFQPLNSLSVGPNAGSGGPRTITHEAATGLWVMYFHGTPWGKMLLPTDCYRATTTDISIDDWTITNNNCPIIKRAHKYEFDQVADISVATSPGGTTYAAYTGADNRYSAPGASNSFNLMMTMLLPEAEQWDGNEWVQGSTGFDSLEKVSRPDQVYNYQNVPWLSPQGAYTIGAWGTEVVSGAAGGVARYNSSAAQNDAIFFDTPPLAPGNYTITVVYQTSAAGGKNAVTLNGVGQGSLAIGTIDSFSVGTVNNVSSTLAFTIYGTETVRWRIGFTISAKNASSSGYQWADYGFTIQNAFIPASPTYNYEASSGSVSGLTFTRTGTAWYDSYNAPANSLTKDASSSANAARFHTKRNNLVPLGLYLEDGTTNLFLNSTAAATQTIAVSNATAYTLSFYGTGSIVCSGAATNTLNGTGINDLVQVTFTTGSTSLTCTVSGSITDVQVEARPTATSRVVTAGASVTRNVEKLSTTSISWFNANAGTILCEFIYECNSNGVGGIFSLDDASANNRIDCRAQSGGLFITSGGVNQYSPTYGAYTADGVTINRIGLAYSASGAISVKNSTGQTNLNTNVSASTITLPVGITTLNLGSLEGGTSVFNGFIRCFQYWPFAMNVGQLQNLVVQG